MGEIHQEHVPESNITNDQFLTSVSLDFGKNAAQPGADLLKTLQPIVEANFYRKKYRYVSRIVVPAVGAGTVTWVFTPVAERWKVIAASLENGDVANMTVATGVRDQANITGERRVANFRVASATHEAFIGAGASLPTTAPAGAASRGNVPAFVDCPGGDELLLIVTPSTGNFDGSEIALRMLIKVLPREIRRILTIPSLEVVP